MLSAQHTNTEVQPAADHALLILYAEGRLGKPNFIHYHSQPSRSTKMFKRADESEALKVRFGHTTTVIDDRIILIGGGESTEGILPSNSLVLNSTSLYVNEQKTTLPVLGHGAVPIRGSKILITFGIQAIAPQRTFATPIQEIDVNTMNVTSLQFFKGEVPQPRYDHTTTKIDDNKIFIYGGKNKDEVVLGDLFYFDLDSNIWNPINQPSHPIAGHSSILVNNYLISCFGIGANAKVINDCNIFDISSNTFIQPIINGALPIPRTLSSMVSFEDKSIIYIFGGIDENSNGLNDLYKLDASNAPTLLWSPISVNSKTTNNKLIPSGRGAHSAFTIEDTDIMTIWGGISNGNQLVDSNFYFFDIIGNAWVDRNFYNDKVAPPQISLDGIKKPESKRVIVILGVIGTIVLIIGFIGFFIIRKRRVLQKFQKKEINNEPYSQSGQFGSNTYLINDFESKQAQFKIIDEPEPVPEPIPQPIQQQIPQPAPTLSSPPTKVEKESETSNDNKHNDSLISKSPKKMSFGKLPDLTNAGSTSETQRMKRTHKRTSSVSLTSSELANITRSRNFTHHKSSLSTNSITSSVNRSSLNNSHHNSRKSNILDTVSEKDSNNRNSSTSDRSVNSVQWVGFNSSMIYDQEKNRDSLHVRNLSYKQQKNSAKYHDGEDEEYTINGDYIDTSPRVNNNYNRNIFDHDEVIRAYDVNQRKNGPQNYPARNNILRRGNIAAESNESTSRESGIIDHESQNSSESSDIDRTSNEEDKFSSIKKSKRSSRGISRVSFALKDEKIEFDENESSSTVSLTRRSLSSQSSTSSSATPSIIEEEDIAKAIMY
ncbi:hypothetical protein RclHR1_09230005 [Rhizophagus clarus]|nr:hypothetical protein RclHR1_09230005 [Rhizophagus clarus]